MYGTQDASRIWQKTWAEFLETKGVMTGRCNPALFKSDFVIGFCHGDDFVIAACIDEARKFGEMLKERFDIRCTGLIGAEPGLDRELVVLNRTVRFIREDCIQIEADLKHVTTLLKELGLEKCNPVKTPRIKLSAAEAESIEMSPKLDSHRATLYRSGTMRCAYLAQDRVDISETVKCLSRAMSCPSEGHFAQLKRLARYLKGSPRCALEYPAQSATVSLMLHVDSDWAGDPITRRSTTGMVARMGEHLLRHTSTVQSVIGLSSAEAEFYAITRGACVGLGIQSVLADWAWHVPLEIYTDSSSAKAIALRR
eukprot:6349462-Amphidinium_carterae.1